MKNLLPSNVRAYTKEIDSYIESKESRSAIVILESHKEQWKAKVENYPLSLFRENTVAIYHHINNLLNLIKDKHMTPSYAVAKLAQIEAEMEMYKVYDNAHKKEHQS